MLLIAGDLTQVGSDVEVDCVIDELSAVDVPIVAVLGNHDHHAGQPERVSERLTAAGIEVLEGRSTVVPCGRRYRRHRRSQRLRRRLPGVQRQRVR